MRRGHGRPHRPTRSRRSRASSSSSSRCSTTRSTARSATRPASARCRSCTSSTTTPTRASTCRRSTRPRSSTSARTSCSTRSAASCARAASASCDEVAGEHQLEFAHRGDHEILTTAPGEQLDNPYSLNTVDVCPVGALTAKDFRFTMRAWELEATPSVCNGCATGCNIEIHHKNERAWRLVPRHNPDVNEYWMCDEGRFTYHDLREERLAGADRRRPARRLGSRDRARPRKRLARAAQGPGAARRRAVGACTRNEDNFALAKLAQAWGVRHVLRRRQAAGAGARRRQPARRRRQPEHRRRRGDRRGARRSSSADAEPRLARRRDRARCVVLGDVLAGVDAGRARASSTIIAIAAHERGPVPRSEGRAAGRRVGRDAGHDHEPTRATCSACTRRSRRPVRRSPAWEAVVRLAHGDGRQARRGRTRARCSRT